MVGFYCKNMTTMKHSHLRCIFAPLLLRYNRSHLVKGEADLRKRFVTLYVQFDMPGIGIDKDLISGIKFLCGIGQSTTLVQLKPIKPKNFWVDCHVILHRHSIQDDW